MTTPQLIISLSPQGELVTELPGLNGSRRKINLQEPSNTSLGIENAIELIEALLNLNELQSNYNFLASKTTHLGSKEEKAKQLTLTKLQTAEIKISEAAKTISNLNTILSLNDTTVGIIYKLLNNQLISKHTLNSDGLPTEQQVLHWQRHGYIETDKNGKEKIVPKGSFSDPSCPFCKSENRFEPGFNRERSITNLSVHEALRQGLIYRGYEQSKNNPDVWNKPKSRPIWLKPNSKVLDEKHIEWSKSHVEALITDGKIHAKTNGFTPADTKRHGAGKSKKIVTFVKETKQERNRRLSDVINF